MKHIDEAKLESDLIYRFQYLTEFMGFGEKDIQVIVGAKALLAPVVPALVDAVYDKLFSFDATKRHFVPVQSGYTGAAPVSINDLSHTHPMIQFRKDKLTRYLVRLVSGPYDANMVKYLDFVGEIHTAKAGKPDIVVPLVQMNALMGFVADAVIATISSFDIPAEDKTKALRAYSKLLWIQNDLITRHYQK
ncbi:MAG TPA: protoglobin family protein [Planctomycetota bacterium]|nr:protoglobin family protein [Planctomycetota bacterium]